MYLYKVYPQFHNVAYIREPANRLILTPWLRQSTNVATLLCYNLTLPNSLFLPDSSTISF